MKFSPTDSVRGRLGNFKPPNGPWTQTQERKQDKMGNQNLLHRQMEWQWRRLKIPATVLMELTPRCTLDCKMCYVHLTREQMGDRRELTTEQWIRIIDEALPMGLFRVVLTGGECMLHEGFWEIYKHLRDNGILVSVNTNGLLLTDEAIARFRANPPAVIRMTLYGADDDGYERCTGHRAFTQILQNIRKLLDAGIKPVLTLTVSRYNQDQMLQILQIARDLHLPVRFTMDLMDAEDETGRSLERYTLTPEEIALQTGRLYDFYRTPRTENPPLDFTPKRLPTDPNCRGISCAAGRSHYLIHWDGRMAACFGLDTNVYVQEAGYAAGVRAAQELADTVLTPVECRTCELRRACLSCVVTRADPKDPAHCNPAVCRRTELLYRAGLATTAPKEDGLDPDLASETDVAECPPD